MWCYYPLVRGTQRRLLPKCIQTAIKSTLRSLEMHYNQRCKICICSVILGELKAFWNYMGLSVFLSKSLDVIEHFTKLTIFLISHSIIFLNSEIKGFLFLQKLAEMRTKMWKNNLRKLWGIFEISFENCNWLDVIFNP